jgi:hypothetical protein
MSLSVNQQLSIQGGDGVKKPQGPPPPPTIVQSGIDCGGR